MVLTCHVYCSKASECKAYQEWTKSNKSTNQMVIMKFEGGEYTCAALNGKRGRPFKCERLLMLSLLEKIAEGKGANK